MHLYAIAPALLIVAIGLSWGRFIAIFRERSSAPSTVTPLTVVACTVSLSAFGLAFGSNISLPAEVFVATLGPLLGRAMPPLSPSIAIPLAALILGIYLKLSPIASI